MAVAVKTSPGPKSSKVPSSPAVMSLVGVVYVVVCLALLFQIIPSLFWMGWELVGFEKYVVQGGALLMTLSFVLAGLFLYIGAQFSGEQAPVGVRAGTFVGVCGVLLILLLTRWASVWIEHWAYNGQFGTTGATYGAIVTAVFGVALLVIALRLFFTQSAQDWIVSFEEAGWFTTTAFKANQGQLVRRGTIFGILLLAGAGIYTLLINNTLRRYGSDLALDVPFTGRVAIEDDGLPRPRLDVPLSPGEKAIQERAGDGISGVEVRGPGATRLQVGQQLSLAAYRSKLEALLADKDNEDLQFEDQSRNEIKAALDAKSPVKMIGRINRLVSAKIQDLLGPETPFAGDTARRIRDVDQGTPYADQSRLVEFIKREAAAARIPVDVPPELNLPIAVLLVDRFAMREVFTLYAPPVEGRQNETQKTVVVTFPGALLEVDEKKWVAGAVVPEKEFTEAKKDLKGRPPMPLATEAVPPSGPLRYMNLVLLPAIQYTVPLLLILVALWFAWRAVNLPVFADFLIATEAELNKVSWTSQKRLIQDTIVVLVTVFLMAVFLFLVDWGWKTVLQLVRVLYIPPVSKQQEIEKKKW
jgi:preprotein translocase SecE subunit